MGIGYLILREMSRAQRRQATATRARKLAAQRVAEADQRVADEWNRRRREGRLWTPADVRAERSRQHQATLALRREAAAQQRARENAAAVGRREVKAQQRARDAAAEAARQEAKAQQRAAATVAEAARREAKAQQRAIRRAARVATRKPERAWIFAALAAQFGLLLLVETIGTLSIGAYSGTVLGFVLFGIPFVLLIRQYLLRRRHPNSAPAHGQVSSPANPD
ncbi:MAG: hypothetical protein WBL53_01125 [Pseudonocardiaceae bacterium]